MNREVIPYTTREAWLAERAQDITSTTVSALFGVCPWVTKFELWHHLHAGLPLSFEANERTTWGKRFENEIANGTAEDKGWDVVPMREYIRIPELRIGSSFDYRDRNYQFLVEAKNVDGLMFRDGWEETEFGLEAPAHIEIQAQHEMLVSEIPMLYIAAVVGGNRSVVLERAYDEQVGKRIMEECAAFWSSPCPAPDFRRDAELISRLYRLNGKGDTMDADERIARLMDEAAQFTRMQAVAKDECEARLAELRTLIGNAGNVVSPTHKLSRWTVKETPISYTRAAYDVMRITDRKQK
jgi:predicted phage-related endonuclease